MFVFLGCPFLDFLLLWLCMSILRQRTVGQGLRVQNVHKEGEEPGRSGDSTMLNNDVSIRKAIMTTRGAHYCFLGGEIMHTWRSREIQGVAQIQWHGKPSTRQQMRGHNGRAHSRRNPSEIVVLQQHQQPRLENTSTFQGHFCCWLGPQVEETTTSVSP